MKNFSKGLKLDELDNEKLNLIDPQTNMSFARIYGYFALKVVAIFSIGLFILIVSFQKVGLEK